MKYLLPLLLLAAMPALAGPQTMQDAAKAFRVCRQIPKADRDLKTGRQAAQAWLDSSPSGADERLPRVELLQAMVKAYGKAMRERGAYTAMGCSEGILDRVETENWSSFHQGVREVLKQQGMGELLRPGG